MYTCINKYANKYIWFFSLFFTKSRSPLVIHQVQGDVDDDREDKDALSIRWWCSFFYADLYFDDAEDDDADNEDDAAAADDATSSWAGPVSVGCLYLSGAIFVTPPWRNLHFQQNHRDHHWQRWEWWEWCENHVECLYLSAIIVAPSTGIYLDVPGCTKSKIRVYQNLLESTDIKVLLKTTKVWKCLSSFRYPFPF